jgi:hypothetical protein
LELPSRWNPVKMEGDWDAGSVLIADLHRPRLGLRWSKAGKKADAGAWAKKAMRQEVGQLAAEEAQPLNLPGQQWDGSTLYIEPEPPGRDVWVGLSRASNRCVEVIHHAHRRESILTDAVLPPLRDTRGDESLRWSVFDLSCVSPPGMKLATHRLNAGDLALMFEDRRRLLTVRQIALAQMALKRMSMEKWLVDQENRRRKFFRCVGKPEPMHVLTGDSRRMDGIVRTMVRRRRYFMLRSLSPQLVTAVLNDEARDRLVIVQASDEASLREAAGSVGWAS